MFNKRTKIKMIFWVLICLANYMLASCSFKTPETHNPVPGLEQKETLSVFQDGTLSIKKSFFGINIDQKQNKVTNERKKWLCGWAVVSQSGRYKNLGGTYNGAPIHSMHCNLEFRIYQDYLEAREVNPDKLDYNEWTILFTIPINSHYFYEKSIDGKGREQNSYGKIEKENWKTSPVIDLDLSRINIRNFNKRVITDVTIRASDVEVSKDDNKNFLGFTTLNTSSWTGSAIQNELRFNFLEIKKNSNFIPTRYHKRNSNYVNVLHIFGNRPHLSGEDNFAGRWDLSKPIEVCLNGFPEDENNYKQIAIDVLNETNRMLVDQLKATPNAQKAFVVSKKKYKYHYDLRCPSITWVNDPKLSLRAPLGIGLTNADITTGEFLWGGAVIWGGLLHYLVNQYSPSITDEISKNVNELVSGLGSYRDSPYFQDINARLNFDGRNTKILSSDRLLELSKVTDSSYVSEILKRTANHFDRSDKVDPSFKLISNYRENRSFNLLGKLQSQILEKSSTYILPEFKQANFHSEKTYLRELLDYSNQGPNILYGVSEYENRKSTVKDIEKARSEDGLIDFRQDYSQKMTKIMGFDNVFEKHLYSWQAELAQLPSPLDKRTAARSIVKNTILHEWGHVIGLAHQFQANFLPKPGSIPDPHYKTLQERARYGKNYTSIMDYPSGRTEVKLNEDEVKFQIQDKQTLNYLYNRKYTTFVPGSSDYNWDNEILVNGLIPSTNAFFQETSFLPMCSDADAWLGVNPYCHRWDLGYDAPTAVGDRIDQYRKTFLPRVNYFSEATGSNPYLASQRLWGSTYRLMNSNRTFFDRMSYKLLVDPLYRTAFNRIKEEKEALLKFSEACINPSQSPAEFLPQFSILSLEPNIKHPNFVDTKTRMLWSQHPAEIDKLNRYYRDLYSKFETVFKNVNILKLSKDELMKKENELYKKGVSLTEIQKLCHANKLNLNGIHLILSLKGSDHININYDAAIVPTGMTAGNATSDDSTIWGRTSQLGLLPVKLAVLDSLTDISSTMSIGPWHINKPQYSDPLKGRFAYYPLYPKEFTEIMTTSVLNNMSVGGESFNDVSTFSVANLYKSFFLNNAFSRSKSEQKGFDPDFLRLIEQQTEFSYDIVSVLLEAKENKDKPGKIFGFTPKIFSSRNSEIVTLTEAFLLPFGKTIIKGLDRQIIIPISRIRFFDKKVAFVSAIRITYDIALFNKNIDPIGVRDSLIKKINKAYKECTGDDEKLGLRDYLKDTNFDGIEIHPDIALDENKYQAFLENVENMHKDYYKKYGTTKTACDEAYRTIGLVGATALSLKGIILPQVMKYLE